MCLSILCTPYLNATQTDRCSYEQSRCPYVGFYIDTIPCRTMIASGFMTGFAWRKQREWGHSINTVYSIACRDLCEQENDMDMEKYRVIIFVCTTKVCILSVSALLYIYIFTGFHIQNVFPFCLLFFSLSLLKYKESKNINTIHFVLLICYSENIWLWWISLTNSI